MILSVLSAIGAALSIFGAILVASKLQRRRRAGFMTWIISNLILILWCALSQNWNLLAMQLFFLGTSGQGWWNNRGEA